MIFDIKKRITAIMVCLAMVLSFSGPACPAYAADGSGSFCIYAAISSETLIAPARISYSSGQTIREALDASEYSFERHGIYTDVIEGTEGSFEIIYDGGGFDLDQPAQSITAVMITENRNQSEEHLALLKSMVNFQERTDNARNYPEAAEAYEEGMTVLRLGDHSGAADCRARLDNAVSAYEAIMNGTKYTVSVSARQNGSVISNPKLNLTDAYCNVTSVTGTTANVVAGTYKVSVSDGGWNRIEKTITVTGRTPLSVELPYGEWFGNIDFKDQSTKKAYTKTQDDATHTLTVNVPDTAGKTNPIISAGQGSVPDSDKTKLYGVYIGIDGKDYSNTKKSWGSNTATLASLIHQGMDERTFTLEARYDMGDGLVQIQSYNVEIRRVPTLTSLSILDGSTAMPLKDGEGNVLEFDPLTNEYNIVTTADSLNIEAEAFGTDYDVNGVGEFTVTRDMTRTVSLEAGGRRNTYTFNITKAEPVSVALTVPTGTEAGIYNSADSEVSPQGSSYQLVEGEKYYYIATKDIYYHTKYEFTAASGLTINVKEPDTVDRLSDLAFYNASSSTSRKKYDPDSAFVPADHSIIYTVPDSASSLYSQATADADYTVYVEYHKQTSNADNGSATSVKIENAVGDGAANVLKNALISGGYSQELTVRVSKSEGNVIEYQDYDILIKRIEHIRNLTISDGYSDLSLMNSNGQAVSFDRDMTEYSVSVPRETESIMINGEFMNEKTDTPVCGGYFALIKGEKYDSLAGVVIGLDQELDHETFTIEVGHEDINSVDTAYTFTVNKTEAISVTFETEPADATVFVTDGVTGKHIEGTDKVFELVQGRSYEYTVTAPGYVGQRVADYQAPQENGTVTVSLVKAAANGSLPDYEAYWSSSRFDEFNNACVDVETPTVAEDTTLYWATQVGSGYSSNACGCPIIVDGYIYTYAGDRIYKIDTISGEILKSKEMDHASSFAINNPTYAEGMIFVGLADGTIQAFNADTLESLWIYHDGLKGQPDCPIVYHDGYIYTGFWNGESAKADYVCLSVTDEDPSQTKEEKLAAWTYTSQGGFYWAGAYVSDDYMLIGTDDGRSGYTTGYAKVISLDPGSGNVIDSYTLSSPGDIRSGITFNPNGAGGGTGYFTTKGGHFFKVGVEADGRFAENSLKKLKLPNYASDASNPGMSTSTPAVYNGRAYVGVSGTNQFGQYSGHNITVIDLNNWSIAYSVRTQGYPQSSGLITTAYVAETGSVNIYFFDNYTPGKLRMITDKPGQTKASPVTVETYTESGSTTSYDTGYVLFTPYANQAQYCICSPITDEYGTLYFKNDSAYMMAVGNSIVSIEVTKEPDKMSYAVGDVFDPTGMVVEAVYSNGLRRDVTDYVEYSDKPLTLKDDQIQIYFPYVMYHDEEGAPGTKVQEPFANLKITVEDHVWSELTYTWAEDNLSVTAKAICSDCGKELTETVNAVYSVIKQPTDTEDGEGVYQSEAFKNEIFKVQTKTVVIPAGDHIYGEPTWSWAEDYSSASAAFSCTTCADKQTVNASVTSMTKEATCTEVGETVYTAEVTFRDKQYSDTKTVKTEAKGHQYEEEVVKATLKEDGSIKRKCTVCQKTEPEAVICHPKTFKLSKTAFEYDGKAKKPTVTVKDTAGNVLVKDGDYTVKYVSGRKKIGTYKVTVTMKGNYSGSKSLTFTIKPAKVKGLKLTSTKKNQLKVTYTKAKGGVKYQLAYRIKGKKAWKKVTVKGASKLLKSLKGGKTYQVKVRAFKKVSGKTYYGAWSAVKTKKVKK